MSYVATDAEAYERGMGRWSRRLAEPFLDACALPPGARVLDAGCGTGALSEAIRARDATAALHGIDLGEAFLVAARRRVPGARFDRGDITALAAPDAGFDAALSLLVLEFIPDRAHAVAELRRVTRPGGLVAAAMWDFTGGLGFIRLFADTAAPLLPAAEAWRARHWADPVGTPGRLATLFQAAGLQQVREQDLLIRTDFTGFEDWWQPWQGGQGIVGAFIAGLPAAQQALLRDAAWRAWCAGGQDGPRSFAAVARMAMGIVPAA